MCLCCEACVVQAACAILAVLETKESFVARLREVQAYLRRCSSRLWLSQPSGRWQRCWSEAVISQLRSYSVLVLNLNPEQKAPFCIPFQSGQAALLSFGRGSLVRNESAVLTVGWKVRGPILVLYKVDQHNCRAPQSP